MEHSRKKVMINDKKMIGQNAGDYILFKKILSVEDDFSN
jgi:hypothetical protein